MSTKSPPLSAPEVRQRAHSHNHNSKIWLTAWGFSLGLHIVAILLYGSRTFEIRAQVTLPATLEEVLDFRGTQIIDLVEIPSVPETPPPDRPLEPEDLVEPEVVAEPIPVPEETVVDSVSAPVTDEGDPRSSAEIIRLDATNPDLNVDLWSFMDPEAITLTDSQLMALLLAIDIERMAGGFDEVADPTDWTFEDANGGRWGIADRMLYLGSFAIPLPFDFGTNPWMRDEIARRSFEDEAIRRGIITQAVQQTLQERARAIRERIDRERAERRGEVRDTTRIRRNRAPDRT